MPFAPLPDAWMPDPLTAVYRRIRTGLIGCPSFLAAIESNPLNFIDGSSDTFRKFDEQAKDTDFPEVVMVQSARRLSPTGSNSMTAGITQSFDLISTVRRLNVLDANTVTWWMFVAMYGLGPDLALGSLVREWLVVDAADHAFSQQEWKRGAIRYSSVARINVTLSIPRQTLNALLLPPA